MATRVLGNVPRGKRLVALCEQTASAMAVPMAGNSTSMSDHLVHLHARRRVGEVPDGASSGPSSRAAPKLRASVATSATFASSASTTKDQDDANDQDARYHREADHTLDVLSEEFERMIEEANVEDADIELSQGVLTLKLGGLGTYVINKQAPNRQIWMSSPVSGPKRFDLVNGFWVNSRNDCFLHDVLQNEMRMHVGFEVDVSPCSHCERENACLDNYECVRECPK